MAFSGKYPVTQGRHGVVARCLSVRWASCCVTIVALTLMSCATPSEKIAAHTAALGFDAGSLIGSGFRHAAYSAGIDGRSDTLRVYIEHDGTPWLDVSHVSSDPTPRSPIALELMARDTGPRLWLGRPCYFEFKDAPGCAPLMWTHRRYSPEVVTSMVAALRQFLADTVDLQTEFLINRLDAALPKMLAEASPSQRQQVQQRFEQLAALPRGCYAG